jgi:uncharacterized protein YyaL (SSP411 family)
MLFAAAGAAVVVATLVLASAFGTERSAAAPPLVQTVRQGLRTTETDFAWRGWLSSTRRGRSWAPIWQSVHVLDAAAGVAAATHAPADTSRLRALADAAEGYWDGALGRGLGGYSTFYAATGERHENWFDDNGWLGLAFLSAYEVTGQPRYLRDAEHALSYMLGAGWDTRGGGIWWSTARGFKAGESVVTAALLAANLHDDTHDRAYLRDARRLVDWADAHLFDRRSHLYLNRPGGVPISYLQSPMIDTIARLCRSDGLYCDRLHALVNATLRRFSLLRHAPQYDAMYVRFLVDSMAIVRDPRILLVARTNAGRVLRNARTRDGLFSRDWNGTRNEVRPGSLQAHAASLEALAWAAVALGQRIG